MTRNGPASWRSVLFAPANRPELVAKLPRSNPDVVVFDLEDAVPEQEKNRARELVVDAVLALDHLARDDAAAPRIAVRVNGRRTVHFATDCEALAGVAAGLRRPLTVFVPKAEASEDLAAVDVAFATAGATAPPVVAGLETARGVADAHGILAADWVGCYFGAEDFITDLGGRRTESNLEIGSFRSMITLAARLAGVVALDVVCTDYGDDQRFRTEAGQARDLGYAGKLCIHPAQVPLANAGFLPSDTEISHARRVLAAWESAVAAGRGAISVDGQLVDEPMVTRARAVVRSFELGSHSA